MNCFSYIIITPFEHKIKYYFSICRTKAYGFGIFYAGEKEQQPYIFLAGKSETESQKWMQSIRDVLKSPIHPSTFQNYNTTVL